jgi:NAD(P)-dependent dehydrogenase (short-subunit alcohol dehydrogenase family)
MNNLFSLEGKVAIVTGGLGLIGKNHCEALYSAGANVVIGDLDKNKAEEFAHELGERCIGGLLDVTDKSNIESMRKHVIKKYGHIDILVNDAAINDKFEDSSTALENSKFENFPLDAWNRSIEVNVTGTFLCCQILGQEMLKQKKGSIINISSTYGLAGPDQSIYVDENGNRKFWKSPSYPVTKGAIISFTKFLAAYWGNAGVRVNTLTPGGVENNQDENFIKNYSKRTPLGRMAAPSDYNGALVFLASDAASYMTGANLVVDGGWTCW